jgi:hypothetical protein
MEHDPAAGASSGSDNKPASPEDQSKVSATGMFDVVPAAGPPVAPSVPAPVPGPPAPSAPPAQPSFQAVEIPVVHEVVFPASGVGAEGSPSILSTLRNLAADEKVRAAELPPSSFVKSELPPPKPDPANTFVKSPASAGFTQLLQAISEKPAAPSVAPPPSPPPIQTNPAPSQVSSSAASFTRILRALDADQASPPTPPVTPPAQVEPLRQEAQTRYTMPPAESHATSVLRTPEPAAKSTPPPAAPTAVFQSPFIHPVSASEPEIEPPPSAGSFTQLFQALDPKAPDQPAQPAPTAQPSPISPLPPPSADSPKSPGTFTQFFSAIDPPIPPAPSAPTLATAIHQSAATPPPPADPAAGSFTQLFQAIDQGSPAAKTPLRPEPQSPAMPAVPEPHSPGSFTQLFQAVGSSATEPPPAPAPRSFNPSPTPANTHPTPPGGSFTELFRAIDPGTNPQPPAPIAQRPPSTMATVPGNNPEPQPPSSFTQIFRAIEGTPPPSAAEYPLQTWGQAPQSQSAPIVPPPYAPPVHEAPHSEGSNLTQLLRNLDQSGSVEPPPPSPAKKPDAFTSLYGERQSPINQVERMQSASPATNVGQPPRTDFAAVPGRTAPPDSPVGGASDFTRIIQASSLREQALKQGEQSIEAPKAAAPAAPAAPIPSQPQIPGFPGAAPPQFPHPSVLPPLNFGQGGAMPPAQPFRAQNLAPPQWMPPAPQPPAPAPLAKAQPLLPLILIGIIFLLIVVLVAVIFLMKR